MKQHFGTVCIDDVEEDIIILGYNVSYGSCLVCRVNQLPNDEGEQVKAFAKTHSLSQYLLTPLRRILHDRGQDWFAHLVSDYLRSDDDGEAIDHNILQVPLDAIDTMNEQQRKSYQQKTSALHKRVREKTEHDEERARLALEK